MKKIYKLAILSFSVLGIASCDLTMVPEDEVIPDRYFKTESDLMLWSNQFYRDILLSADWGSTTDLMMTNGISAYVSGNRTPQTQSWSFSALRDINYMLEHLDQCEDAAVATKYEALGRFFRAYFYFKMVRTYGDVPYYDKVLGSTDPDIYKARDSREYVMQRVLGDEHPRNQMGCNGIRKPGRIVRRHIPQIPQYRRLGKISGKDCGICRRIHQLSTVFPVQHRHDTIPGPVRIRQCDNPGSRTLPSL